MLKKQTKENPIITKNFDYEEGRYQITGKLGQHYRLFATVGKYNCEVLNFDSSEIDDLISLLETIKEYESQELMKESCQ